MASLADSFLGQAFEGIQDSLYSQGYDFVVFRWTPDVRMDDRFLRSIVDRRVEGVIIAQGDDTRDYRYLKELQKFGTPVVAIDREVPVSEISFVGSDDYDGARQAIEHLINLGHKKIVFLAKEKCAHLSTYRKRFEGYRDTMLGCRLFPQEPWVIPEHDDLQECYDYIRGFLRTQDRPTALFCENDFVAADFMSVARQEGIAIPDDMSVIGYADDRIATCTWPKLTTVNQNPNRIGVESAKLLIKLIESKRKGKDLNLLEPKRLEIPTSLVVRESTSKVRK
jgi:DNA-binding LacI/PurR family transcriptional regulator